jgi:hypothetical protein
MPHLPTFLGYLTSETRRRASDLRQRARQFIDARGGPDQGASTAETVVIIALLVVLALGVMAIITAKVLAKANSINLN